MTFTTTRLDSLLVTGNQHLLCGGLKGLEKESLRLAQNGFISQTQHPHVLGSALTHPAITTDYSEALIELITPPFADVKDTLHYLQQVHQFVYAHLDGEILLGASMPCGIDGDDSIRIAEYGTSNVGRMKHIYRHGLWHRYGRTMQSIAGIHFNYSVPENLWAALHQHEHSPLSLAQFTNDGYFGLIRNFQRVGWLILYLFGASPAICKNFFKSRPALMTQFDEFDNGTLYHPFATSLRMSDIGYKSNNQASLNIDYNSLDGYVDSLGKAITTPYPDYEKIGTVVDGEILLGASMPCGIDGDDSIRIAEYGTSNVGRMKHIYRHGLWHRYGRTMQSIAGIHFNYSVPENLWAALHQHEHSALSLAQFTNDGYFGLIRNFQRVGWLILYLFGASPAICKNFFKSRPALMTQFDEFDNGTLYHPFATSLRMSDIGYKSNNQASLNIDYNSLDGYVDSLGKAITTPYPDYEKIGTVVDGEYRQLNCNILQIENEFYSTIRPKQIAQSCEKPTLALKRRGVRYIEMRSLDLDIFNPLGVDEGKLRFIEALLLTCLLTDSPAMSAADHKINNANQLAVANEGRKPDLMLNRNGQHISLQDWANDILQAMQPVCAVLDHNAANKPYSAALAEQRLVVDDANLTASARMLAAMREHSQPFARFALNTSAEHARYFQAQPLDTATTAQFVAMAAESHAKQREIENKPQLPFAEFLQRYFDQTCSQDHD